MLNNLNILSEVSPRGDALCLLDADYLAYLVGGVSQNKQRDEKIIGQEYVCVNEEKDTWVYVDPIHLVHWRIDNEIEKIKRDLFTTEIEVWLTPEHGNFREKVAVSKKYKGQRSKIKPYWQKECREYMLRLGAFMSVDCEADDMVCTRQRECMQEGRPSIITGPDKDLLNMYGDHWNPTKKKRTWVTWEEAAFNFYGQMITGDPVDNIPGIKGRGKVLNEILLKESDNLEDYIELVMEAYIDNNHTMAYFLEQGRLLHMRRKIGEMWSIDYDWEEGYRELNQY